MTHHDKSSVLARPGKVKNGAVVLMATGGLPQLDVSPCMFPPSLRQVSLEGRPHAIVVENNDHLLKGSREVPHDKEYIPRSSVQPKQDFSPTAKSGVLDLIFCQLLKLLTEI